jgi:cyclohexa-1,5-dienecarbonyl-CoA hydratase
VTSGAAAVSENIRVEKEGGLRTLVLERPPVNVLDIKMLEQLRTAVQEIREDPDASVLLVTGEGKAFCAGVDVSDHTEDRVGRMIEVLHHALTDLMALEIPVVAALNGAALGGGLELALACDVIVARERAKLGQPEIRLGVFPPFAAVILPRLIGRGAALDLCLSGRTIPAEEAHALGLVQQVLPADDFPTSARAYALDLASLSPAVLRLTKRVVVDGLDRPVDDALRAAEERYLNDLMRLDDAHEGLAAFLEKRDPVWKGA